MKIDIIIDRLPPCLVEIKSGKIHQTTFSVAKSNEISANSLIEKYTLEGDLNVR